MFVARSACEAEYRSTRGGSQQLNSKPDQRSIPRELREGKRSEPCQSVVHSCPPRTEVLRFAKVATIAQAQEEQRRPQSRRLTTLHRRLTTLLTLPSYHHRRRRLHGVLPSLPSYPSFYSLHYLRKHLPGGVWHTYRQMPSLSTGPERRGTTSGHSQSSQKL